MLNERRMPMSNPMRMQKFLARYCFLTALLSTAFVMSVPVASSRVSSSKIVPMTLPPAPVQVYLVQPYTLSTGLFLASTNGVTTLVPSMPGSLTFTISNGVPQARINPELRIQPMDTNQLLTGIFSATPYTMTVVVPELVDSGIKAAVHDNISDNMPWFKPELRLERRK